MAQIDIDLVVIEVLNNWTMNAGKFGVVPMRNFVVFVDQDSGEEFRISEGDLILLTLRAPRWKTGDVVDLSAEQQKTLVELHARCLNMGDEAVKAEIQKQNQYGAISWVIVLAVLAYIIFKIHGCASH